MRQKLSLDGLTVEKLEKRVTFYLELGYDLYDQVRLLFLSHRALTSEQFGTTVTVTGTVADNEIETLSREILDISAGTCHLVIR